jgi:hypothetical protein
MEASMTTAPGGLARGRTLRIVIAAVVASLTMALVPAAADAHRLSKSRANKVRNAAANQMANLVNGAQFTDSEGNVITLSVEQALVGACTRRSAHKFTCPIGATGTAYYDNGFTEQFLCTSTATARFKNSRSRQVRGSYTDPVCGPAPTASGASLSKAPKKRYVPTG